MHHDTRYTDLVGGVGSLLLLALAAWFLWQRRPSQTGGVEDVLADAEQAGIISADQRRAILNRTAESEPTIHLSGVTWLAVLAGLFVLAGTSLLIATNWEDIGATVRIAAFLVLLLGVGEAAIRARTVGLAISLELVWLILPLLGIGLYAQTFQLSGETITPFLVWLVLGMPLAWRSTHAIVPLLHTASLIVVSLTGSFFVGGPLYLLTTFDISAWAVSLGTVAVVVVQSLKLLPIGQRHHCFGVVAGWVFGVLLLAPPFHLEHGAWVAIAAVALATLWLVALFEVDAGPSEILGAATVWIGILYTITFAWHSDGSIEGTTTAASIAGTLLVAAAAAGGILHVPASPFGNHALLARIVLAAPLALSFALLLGGSAVHASAALANVLLVGIAGAIMWHGSAEREPGEINFGIFVLLVVLVTRFFDVFGSFVQSGVGFIVAGVLLAALAYTLERTRRRLIGPRETETGR